jgi:parallel beta-helix repeat protein
MAQGKTRAVRLHSHRAQSHDPRFLPSLDRLDDRILPAVLNVGVGQPYSTIASSLQAANPGDTVLIHPGTYQEAVDVTVNNLTLEGVNQSAVIESPTNLTANNYSLVWVNGAKGVKIENLTVEGPYTGGFAAVNGEQLGLHAGIFIYNGGSADIAHNLVTNVYDSPANTTSNDGFGILIGSGTLGTTGSATIENNTVCNYGRGGIDVSNSGSSALIKNNTVTGLSLSRANQYSLQLGIVAESGGVARISNNIVTQNAQTAPGTFAAGIYLYNAESGSTVLGNLVSGNNTGVAVTSTSFAVIAGNDVSNNTEDGIDLTSSTNAAVLLNVASHNGGDGVRLTGTTGSTVSLNCISRNGFIGLGVDAGSTGDCFEFNSLSNNADFDSADLSSSSGAAGTANTWFGNLGKTSFTLSGESLFQAAWPEPPACGSN